MVVDADGKATWEVGNDRLFELEAEPGPPTGYTLLLHYGSTECNQALPNVLPTGECLFVRRGIPQWNDMKAKGTRDVRCLSALVRSLLRIWLKENRNRPGTCPLC